MLSFYEQANAYKLMYEGSISMSERIHVDSGSVAVRTSTLSTQVSADVRSTDMFIASSTNNLSTVDGATITSTEGFSRALHSGASTMLETINNLSQFMANASSEVVAVDSVLATNFQSEGSDR